MSYNFFNINAPKRIDRNVEWWVIPGRGFEGILAGHHWENGVGYKESGPIRWLTGHMTFRSRRRAEKIFRFCPSGSVLYKIKVTKRRRALSRVWEKMEDGPNGRVRSVMKRKWWRQRNW